MNWWIYLYLNIYVFWTDISCLGGVYAKNTSFETKFPELKGEGNFSSLDWVVKYYRTLWTVLFSRYSGSISICFVRQWLKYSEWIWRFAARECKKVHSKYFFFTFICKVTWLIKFETRKCSEVKEFNLFPLCRGICENVFNFFTLTCRKPPNSYTYIRILDFDWLIAGGVIISFIFDYQFVFVFVFFSSFFITLIALYIVHLF
jgi:hypothetical protein